MVKIKTIRVMSLARLKGGMAALIGLMAGILYSFGGALIDVLVSMGWITSAATTGVGYGTALAFMALIGMPIMFGAVGFIAGLIVAGLYNAVAQRIGGVEVDLEQQK